MPVMGGPHFLKKHEGGGEVMKKNCWEEKKCGRELGGEKIKEMGVCPVAVARKANGLNSGKLGGRSCWAIAGTFCKEKVQGSFATKLKECTVCDFYQLVKKEEGADYASSLEIIEMLRTSG